MMRCCYCPWSNMMVCSVHAHHPFYQMPFPTAKVQRKKTQHSHPRLQFLWPMVRPLAFPQCRPWLHATDHVTLKIAFAPSMHKSTCVSRAEHTDGMSSSHDRRIEVIANGLPLWGNVAVNTTLVSPLTRAGRPRMRGGQYRGTALRDARRNKTRTYPEILRDRRCRLLSSGLKLEDVGVMEPQLSWGASPTPKAAKPQPFCATPSPTP